MKGLSDLKRNKAVIGGLAALVVLCAGGLMLALMRGASTSPNTSLFSLSSATGTVNQVTFTANGTPNTATRATPQATSGSTATPGIGGAPAATPGITLTPGTPTPGTLTPGTPTPGTTAGTTPSPGMTVTPAPTTTTAPSPPPTPDLADGATVIGPMSRVATSGIGVEIIYMDIQNAGQSTWSAGWTYRLHCISSCLQASDQPVPAAVAPGQTQHFNIQIETPIAWSNQTYHMSWQMRHSGVAFGPVITMTVTDEVESPLLKQPAPACDNPTGVAWNLINATGNTISCIGAGLLIQQGTTKYPEADVTSIPGLVDTNYHVHVHVHFGDSAGATYAGLALHTTSPCGPSLLVIRSDGAYKITDYPNPLRCGDMTYNTGNAGAATGADLFIVVRPAGSEYWFINGQMISNGGAGTLSGLGLIVEGTSGSSSPIYFSNFEVDAPMSETLQFQVTAP